MNWWKNRISRVKLSWIACSYCLLYTVPSNNHGEKFRGQAQNSENSPKFTLYGICLPPGKQYAL